MQKGEADDLLISDLTKNKFEIKIADLGMARTLQAGNFASSHVGTDMLFAPEVLRGVYDHKIDVWGIAHIFYNLMTRQFLFDGQGKGLQKQLNNGQWKFPLNVPISAEAISFLNDLLQDDPAKRVSIEQLMKHRYLTQPVNQVTLMDSFDSRKFKKMGDDVIFMQGDYLVFNIKNDAPYKQFQQKMLKG